MDLEKEERPITEQSTSVIGGGDLASDQKGRARPMVTLAGISKTYTGGTQAVNGVSLERTGGKYRRWDGLSKCRSVQRTHSFGTFWVRPCY